MQRSPPRAGSVGGGEAGQVASPSGAVIPPIHGLSDGAEAQAISISRSRRNHHGSRRALLKLRRRGLMAVESALLSLHEAASAYHRFSLNNAALACAVLPRGGHSPPLRALALDTRPDPSLSPPRRVPFQAAPAALFADSRQSTGLAVRRCADRLSGGRIRATCSVFHSSHRTIQNKPKGNGASSPAFQAMEYHKSWRRLRSLQVRDKPPWRFVVPSSPVAGGASMGCAPPMIGWYASFELSSADHNKCARVPSFLVSFRGGRWICDLLRSESPCGA